MNIKGIEALRPGPRHEFGAQPGDYVTGRLQGEVSARQGVLVEIRSDGTSVVLGEPIAGESNRYVCEGWLAHVPDRNLASFPDTIAHVKAVRAELAAMIPPATQTS